MRRRLRIFRPHHPKASSLADLRPGQGAILDSIELPESLALRLMELGFLPGCRVEAAHRAPGGDPRVYRVDGSEVALRRETAVGLRVRADEPGGSGS